MPTLNIRVRTEDWASGLFAAAFTIYVLDRLVNKSRCDRANGRNNYHNSGDILVKISYLEGNRSVGAPGLSPVVFVRQMLNAIRVGGSQRSNREL